ncbi:serine/threonine-protein kinase prk-2-like [Oratosquilla oratoria]|uniref:serine/threonine-protein kinase prk-2-like n=1 Tax=Oratosquilla oratoria TaxID=337810 RepID=UPI003F75F1C7
MEFDLETAKVFKRNDPKMQSQSTVHAHIWYLKFDHEKDVGRAEALNLLGAMKLSDFKMHEELGKGGFGCVFRATRVADGLQVAIKKIPLADALFWGRRHGKKVPREAALLQRVQKVPDVIKLHDCFSTKDSFYMVMELIPSAVSFVDYIRSGKELPMTDVKTLFRKIVLTVEGCLEAGVSHKDIKPHNVLLFRNASTGQFDIKLIDFGCSERITGYRGKITGGTRIYCPPEYIKGNEYLHVPATVWSLGTLLFYLVCHYNAFRTNDSIM